jgi:hypothetical protein
MGELFLISGPAHPDKLAAFLSMAGQRLEAGQGRSFLWLVPSPWQALQLRQRLLQAARVSACPRPPVLDLDELTRCLGRLGPRGAFLTESGRRLLIEDLLQGLPLSAFRPGRDPSSSGLAEGLARLFGQCEEAGLKTDDLQGDSPRQAGLRALYAAYLERLGDQWTCRTGVWRAALALVDQAALDRLFPGADLLLLSGFTAFAPPLAALLERLLELFPQTWAMLDYDQERPRLFGRLGPACRFLSQRAASVQVFCPPSSDHPAALLEPHLFARTRASLAAPIELIPCPDRLAEVERIARCIRLLHRDQGAELGQVRVCFPDLSLYVSLVAEVFPRHGLPFHFARGWPLAAEPVVEAVLAVLDTVLEGYSRPSLLRLLRLPWVRLHYVFDGRSCCLWPEILDAWARSLPPVRGRSGWLQAIDRRGAFLERELANLRRGGPLSEEIDDPLQWERALEADLEALRPLRQGLEALFAALAPLEAPLDLGAFPKVLLEALAALGLPEVLEETAPPRHCRAFACFARLLDEVCAPAALLCGRAWPLRALAEACRSALARAWVAEPHPHGVVVALLRDALGLPCDHLLVGGLVEGEFPRQPAEDFFLDEGSRKHLGLEDAQAALEADRLLFYQALCAPRRTLWLFYPGRSGKMALSPSAFVGEVAALLEKKPASPPPEGIFALADLHARLGEALDGPAGAGSALDLFRRAYGLAGLRAPLHRLVRGAWLIDCRGRPEGLSSYEGLLDGPLLKALQSRLGGSHSFSTTQLETYGRCPFRFFASRLLGAEPLPDPEADPWALERGNLVHRILYHYYLERRQSQPDLENLRRIALQQVQEMKLDDFFWEQELERLLGRQDGQGREGVLARFLRLEAASPSLAAPAHFELSFGGFPGQGKRDPHSTARPYVIADPQTGLQVHLSGKIDRIDRTPQGAFLVFDYKTGYAPRLSEMAEGLNLQLPLYLLAAEALLKEAGLQRGVGGAYLLLRDLENCGRAAFFADESERESAYLARTGHGLSAHGDFRQILDQARLFALSYVRAMHRGVFHVTARDPARICPRCPYAQSCRLDQRRMRALARQGRLP